MVMFKLKYCRLDGCEPSSRAPRCARRLHFCVPSACLDAVCMSAADATYPDFQSSISHAATTAVMCSSRLHVVVPSGCVHTVYMSACCVPSACLHAVFMYACVQRAIPKNPSFRLVFMLLTHAEITRFHKCQKLDKTQVRGYKKSRLPKFHCTRCQDGK